MWRCLRPPLPSTSTCPRARTAVAFALLAALRLEHGAAVGAEGRVHRRIRQHQVGVGPGQRKPLRASGLWGAQCTACEHCVRWVLHMPMMAVCLRVSGRAGCLGRRLERPASGCAGRCGCQQRAIGIVKSRLAPPRAPPTLTCQLLRQWCACSTSLAMRSTQRWSNRRQPAVVLHALMRDRRSPISCVVGVTGVGFGWVGGWGWGWGWGGSSAGRRDPGEAGCDSPLRNMAPGLYQTPHIPPPPAQLLSAATHLCIDQLRPVQRKVTLAEQHKLGGARVAARGTQQRPRRIHQRVLSPLGGHALAAGQLPPLE
jgi:hypothetical protein